MRLRFIVEGRTEANFVRRVLSGHLSEFGVFAANPQMVATRLAGRGGVKFSGGLTSWQRTKAEIIQLLREDRSSDVRFTTMFDYYALPRDFPGVSESDGMSDAYGRVELIEKRIMEEVGDERLLPYIQLHEFEALLFADLSKMRMEYLGMQRQIDELQMIAAGFENPELIDGGRETAPSKRIGKVIPRYDKANAGVAIVARIGIETLRCRCRHFAAWIGKLESLGGFA